MKEKHRPGIVLQRNFEKPLFFGRDYSSFRKIRKEMENTPLLTAEEEFFYIGGFQKIKAKLTQLEEERDPFGNLIHEKAYERLKKTGEKFQNKIITANCGLVTSVVDALYRTNYRLGPEDLFQEGMIGLMKAVDGFDVNLGNRFSTYATWWIIHEVERAIDDQARTIRTPAYVRSVLKKTERERDTATQVLGRELTFGEVKDIAKEVERHGGKSSEEAVECILEAHDSVTLNRPLVNNDSTTLELVDLLRDDTLNVESAVFQRNAASGIVNVLRGSGSSLEVTVFLLRNNGSEKSWADISEALFKSELIPRKYSGERMRQIDDEFMRKLKSNQSAMSELVSIRNS